MAVKPIPDGYHSLSPALRMKNASKAIEFYKNAFGAKEISRMEGADGKIMHAELQIGDSKLMLCDEFPEMNCKGPQSVGGCTASLHLYVEDADKVYNRAIEHGATALMPISDAFWGDRYGKVTDPFGHEWGIATRIEDLTEAEVKKRSQEFCANMAAASKK